MNAKTKWVAPDQVFDGLVLRRGLAVALREGCVTDLVPLKDLCIDDVKPLTGILSPGFVDLQVNGGGGVLFNGVTCAAKFETILAAHRMDGTAALLLTVITDAPEALDTVANLFLMRPRDPGILGIHIEGPHISLDKRGTHDARFIRPMDSRTLDTISKLRKANIPVLITLAPEAASSHDVTRIVEMGATVSIGHSNATAQETRALIDAGASCFTHLFNAMSPMLNREPGVVGAAINSDAYAGFICDGHHVADEMLGLAIRARPLEDRMFLVSDSMPTVAGPDSFDLYGSTIHLEGGRLVNAEGSLAGAHVTMLQSVKRLIDRLGLPAEQALRMATSIPLAALNKSDAPQSMLIGARAQDVMLLTDAYRCATPVSALVC